ncbi:MAG TPA: pitrilysin family protein [Terriglobia bacterium]|nr:pitrilysin family protein [Terriglobia bacterium]
MRLVASVLMLLFLQTAPSKPKPVEYEETRLPNGLTVITHEDHSTPVINAQIWYHVGSKDEKPGKTGFAHLFEHLMFKGSAHIKPEEHDKIITNAGGVSNAYTQDDVTVYWETFPANYLEKILWMEADRMATLDVSEENFKSEREVVKEERLTRIENPPYGDLLELLYDNAYDVHPYKHITIGSMADLNAATIQDVREFYKTYYVPDNATVVLAGDFKADQALDEVKKYFADIPRGQTPIVRSTAKEPPHDKERRISHPKAVPLPAYVAGYYIPADGDPDSYPLTIASNILSAGRSSRIYKSLVYDKQLAIQADASGNFTEDPNLFFAILIMNRGASIAEGEKALNAELMRLTTEPVSDMELEKAKNKMRGEYAFGRESVQEKAQSLGHAAVIHRDTATVNKEYELFMKVTKEDIMRVAKTYFRPENRTVLVVTPQAPK